MKNKAEIQVLIQVHYIFSIASDEIIHPNHHMTFCKEPICKMWSQETCCTGK